MSAPPATARRTDVITPCPDWGHVGWHMRGGPTQNPERPPRRSRPPPRGSPWNVPPFAQTAGGSSRGIPMFLLITERVVKTCISVAYCRAEGAGNPGERTESYCKFRAGSPVRRRRGRCCRPAATPGPQVWVPFAGARGHPVVSLTSVSPRVTQGCLFAGLRGYLWGGTHRGPGRRGESRQPSLERWRRSAFSEDSKGFQAFSRPGPGSAWVQTTISGPA